METEAWRVEIRSSKNLSVSCKLLATPASITANQLIPIKEEKMFRSTPNRSPNFDLGDTTPYIRRIITNTATDICLEKFATAIDAAFADLKDEDLKTK